MPTEILTNKGDVTTTVAFVAGQTQRAMPTGGSVQIQFRTPPGAGDWFTVPTIYAGGSIILSSAFADADEIRLIKASQGNPPATVQFAVEVIG